MKMLKRITAVLALLTVGIGAFADANQELYDAVKVKSHQKIRAAIQAGANPNRRFDTIDMSVFNWAIESNLGKDGIETMLYDTQEKVWVNGSDTEFPVLFHAIKAGRKDLIKILVKAGAEPNIDYYGQTPLIYATNLKRAIPLNDFITECKFDPEKEVDLNHKDRHGNTALYYAIKNKNKPCIDVLLKQDGIDITNIDEDGNDAICIAVKENLNEQIVDKLIEKYDGDFTKLVYRSSGKYKNKNPIEIMRINKTERLYEDIFNDYM